MTDIIRTIGAGAVLLLAMHASAAAQEREPRPEVFTRLIDCRAIVDSAQRLACYDAQVAALDQAERDRQLVVVDREQVREARRGLFGLTLPRIGLFDGDDDEDEAFTKIETTIRTAQEDSRGRWIIELADGARWVQIDSRELPIPARAGQTIRIRQAAMGSYLANVNGQIAIRMKREN